MIKISYARGLVLLLTLILSGTANLMCISFDPDHNAQTPPLRVDFSFVVRGHGRIQVQRSAGREDDCGRGLAIIDALAEYWTPGRAPRGGKWVRACMSGGNGLFDEGG